MSATKLTLLFSTDISYCMYPSSRNIIEARKYFQKLFQTWMLNVRKAMAPHSSTLACKIPWIEEPGGLQSLGSLRVEHNRSALLCAFMHWRRKWQPTPVFFPGESQGWGAWWAASYGVAQSRTRLKGQQQQQLNVSKSHYH